MKIWSYTFGCKVNQYETELLRHRIGSGVIPQFRRENVRMADRFVMCMFDVEVFTFQPTVETLTADASPNFPHVGGI